MTHDPATRHGADPTATDAADPHPLATGLDAAGGAQAGAAIGMALAGPLGTAVGAAIGTVTGGLAGKDVADNLHTAPGDAAPDHTPPADGAPPGHDLPPLDAASPGGAPPPDEAAPPDGSSAPPDDAAAPAAAPMPQMRPVQPALEQAYWRDNHRLAPGGLASHSLDDCLPAYRLGYEGCARHPGRPYDEIEALLAAEWEAAKGPSCLSWAQARPAVRAGWRRVAYPLPGARPAGGH